MVLGALVGLIFLVMALGGSRFSRQVVIFMVSLMAATLLAIFYLLYLRY
jgi:hypothetical protein